VDRSSAQGTFSSVTGKHSRSEFYISLNCLDCDHAHSVRLPHKQKENRMNGSEKRGVLHRVANLASHEKKDIKLSRATKCSSISFMRFTLVQFEGGVCVLQPLPKGPVLGFSILETTSNLSKAWNCMESRGMVGHGI